MPEITFKINEESGVLTVNIDTERLHMESVTAKYSADYHDLFGNEDVMFKYSIGGAWADTHINRCMESWITRWATNDPFSALTVSKKDDNAFLGHVLLRYGENPGESELAYAFNKSYWGQGYATEAVSPVVNEYAQELVQRGYQVEGALFQSITATVRIDNEASCNVLKKVGMQFVREDDEHGYDRYVFFKKVAEQVSEMPQMDVSEFSQSISPC